MTDRRSLPPRFQGVDGEAASIAAIAPFLHATPGGARDRQLVHGEAVTVFDRADGWAFVAAAKDGYCGYLLDDDLGAPIAATHLVLARQTHLYPAADIKTPPLLRLPFGARLVVTGMQGRWAVCHHAAGPGFVHRSHIRKLDEPEDDPVAVAERLLGTPYLWAGNTGDGIDCSGLVQAAMLACGLACPGDSDQQEAALGTEIPMAAPVVRGDLYFWQGHVALALDSCRLIHANGYHMAVATERREEAIDRILAQGGGPVTRRRRVTLPGR